MCAGQNLHERERKETRSCLKKVFPFPIFFPFFSFLERVFLLFPIFLGISHPVLCDDIAVWGEPVHVPMSL